MKNQNPLRTFFFLDLFVASSGRFVFSKGPFDLRKSMSWTASPWFYHLGNHQWINAWKLKLMESYGRNQQISLEPGIPKQNPWKKNSQLISKRYDSTGHPRLLTKMVSTALFSAIRSLGEVNHYHPQHRFSIWEVKWKIQGGYERSSKMLNFETWH